MTTRHWFSNFWGRASRRPMRTRKLSRTRTRLLCEEFEPRTLLSIATHFSVVSSTPFVEPGTPFSVTVTAEDAAGQTADYVDGVHFSSNDAQATLPADYTFTAADHGTHTFSGVILRNFPSRHATINVTNGGIGSVAQFSIPTAGSNPGAITAGPDGNVWFTEASGNKVARITPAGAITEFPVPTPSSGPQGITAGPDGNVWFTEANANKIGKITPAGVITEFTIQISHPVAITAGPDHNLWFADNSGNNAIGRISTAGTSATEFHTPTPGSDPTAITAGPDGNLWFTESQTYKIGKITPAGTFTEFPVVVGGIHYLHGITAGPDGNLWFLEADPSYGGTVGRISPAGNIALFPINGGLNIGNSITAGPDGNLWATDANNGVVYRVTPAGGMTQFEVNSLNPALAGIAAGSDDNLWFEESNFNRIGRLATATLTGSTTVALPDAFAVKTTAGNPDVAGTAFGVTVTAQICITGRCVTDTNYRDTVHFTSSDSAATLPGNYTFTAADNGVHTFSSAILRTAGSRGITATDTVAGFITATAHVNVVAASASQFVVSTAAVNPDVAGTPFDVTVTARDVYGNTATGYTGTVHFSSGDPYGATLPPNYTFTAGDQGVHTFAAGATLYTAATTTIAYTNGFGDPSQITANGNTTFPGTPAVLRLTDGGAGEYSSTWSNRPVGLGAFSTTFTLQDQPVTYAGDGLCFVIQADPRGLAALGGSEGYGGIVNSIAIKFDLFTHGYNTPSTGLFTGGAAPDGDPSKDVSLTGINLGSGDPIQVTLNYDGTGTLTETVTDTLTQATFTHAYAVDLAQVIGTNVAYAGFTGSSGAETAVQDIVRWTGSFHSGWDVTDTDTVTGIAGTARVTVIAAPASQFVVSTDAADPDIAGTAFDVAVVATDPYGNTDTNYTGTVTFRSADPYGASLPADYTFQPGDQGMATFSGVTALYTAGTRDVTATDTTSGITGAAFVNVQAAPAVALQVVAPASATSGVAFDVTVIAVDPYGNTDTNYTGTVTFSTSDPDAGVMLPPDYTFQASDAGLMTFPGGVTLITPGDQTLTATDTQSGITGTSTVTVMAGGPAPGAGRFGAELAAPLRQSTAAPAAGRPLDDDHRAGTAGHAAASAQADSSPSRAGAVGGVAHRDTRIDDVWSDPADLLLTDAWVDGLVWYERR